MPPFYFGYRNTGISPGNEVLVYVNAVYMLL